MVAMLSTACMKIRFFSSSRIWIKLLSGFNTKRYTPGGKSVSASNVKAICSKGSGVFYILFFAVVEADDEFIGGVVFKLNADFIARAAVGKKC